MKHFIIQDYQKQKPFSSFLPGIAGKMGIPLWSFYVNRGQLIASFGVRDKNGAIMEFFPANAAYHYVSKIGFRTFIKVNGQIHECFKEVNKNQKLLIARDQVSIEETIESLGLHIQVTYFTLPNENVAGLTRKVTIKNLDQKEKEVMVVDGLMQMLPSGIDYGGYKAISNLLQSWMETKTEEDYVFYKLRASTDDSAEVSEIHDGNFYFSKSNIKPFYVTDYKLIFNEDTSLETPYGLINQDITSLKKQEQALVNQVPCACTAYQTHIKDEMTFISLYGYTKNELDVKKLIDDLSFTDLLNKEIENEQLHDEITDTIETKTSENLLDAYFKQCYLDNVLRGGQPMIFETLDGNIGYHIYSRKHGDLERDYNFFSIEPAFYSQGNGNFRDVLQNRRNDLYFNPQLKDFNIYQFGSLIQADGYNPLSIEGIEFSYAGSLDQVPTCLKPIIKQPFTPGKIATILYKEGNEVDQTIKQLIKNSHVLIKANFGEGYWEDHFTYLYDVIESYQSIYPDQMEHLMFDQKYAYFESPIKVLPRKEKYVLTKDNKVRQFGSLHHKDQPSRWLKNENELLKANLLGKLLTLIANKFAHLDPFGIGLSYEGNKPGWNDAMNGVPGLFGSGVSETIELKKLVAFTKKIIHQFPVKDVFMLQSTYDLINRLSHLHYKNDYQIWDERNLALENYRDQLDQVQVITANPARYFEKFIHDVDQTLDEAIQKAKKLSTVYPTFLTYEATSYELIVDQNGQSIIGHYGLPLAKVKAFDLKPLPLFLEAPARYLKAVSNKEEAKQIYAFVKKTELYDKGLKVYQTSVSLDDYGHEIGRIRAFTKGWLERESDFLHMTYKYLLGLLKSGLYEEFFEEIKTNLTCFMDPKVYGRSPLENSSFIATSNNPDPKKRGQGFVSRLTGSTAEVLSMWRYMFFGDHLFKVEDDQLIFELSPKLPKSWFKDQKIEVKLFNQTQIIYHINGDFNTYDEGVRIEKMTLHKPDGVCEVEGSKVIGKWTKDIRDGLVFKINVYIIGGK